MKTVNLFIIIFTVFKTASHTNRLREARKLMGLQRSTDAKFLDLDWRRTSIFFSCITCRICTGKITTGIHEFED